MSMHVFHISSNDRKNNQQENMKKVGRRIKGQWKKIN